MRGLLIRTFGYGVALVERIHGQDDTDEGPSVIDSVIDSGIRHCSLSAVPGNPDRAFFIMENTDPPHPFQSAQLEEVAEDLKATALVSGHPELSEAARLLRVI